MLALIAQKYQKVAEEVEGTMRGKILEYEAKIIRNEAIREVTAKVREEVTVKVTKKVTEELKAKFAAIVAAKAEQMAIDMLHDQMEISALKNTLICPCRASKSWHGILV